MIETPSDGAESRVPAAEERGAGPEDGERGDRRPDVVPSTFLRLDRAELTDGSTLFLRAVPAQARQRRRFGSTVPLGYLYEQPPESEPAHDMTLSAGHYDETNLVWSFSGEVTGIAGLTEPLPPRG
ncbi:hypothetical protein [Plantactinospora endophytica]|uniref:hypothetical protein n=1 Tax=Plantactinospora endophytica TaxID=673535 RepID=UPI001944F50E|nr:hypothetical protein [Plantactinospora endophytica]